jgi:GT2 family glycosyltransferase
LDSSVRVSLILCSKNGGARLRKCLEAIAALDMPADMEVVLVDNGSTDGTSLQQMEDFRAAGRCDCAVLQEPVPGNSAGRNTGIAAAKGDLLLFLDDDCYAERDFVRAWLSVFASSPIGFGSGMVLRFDPAGSGLGCEESPLERRLEGGAPVERGFIQGSNMAFRRDCLRDAGPFDARFGAGTPFAGEEWDVAMRASAAGWPCGYFPQPKVRHDHQRVGDVARERLLYYDFGAGAVYAKHLRRPGRLGTLLQMLRDLYRLRADGARLRALGAGYAAFRRLESLAV